MSQFETDQKITMSCPSGHRVRGGAELIGRTVRCPKCEVQFVFAATRPAPAPLSELHQVTDTGVMRILGDMSELPPTPDRSQVAFKVCSRCGVAMPESLTVCRNCNCYVGAMPTFMKQISGNMSQRT